MIQDCYGDAVKVVMVMFQDCNGDVYNVQGLWSRLLGASPIADGPRWGEEEGTRLLEDVSGGWADVDTVYNHDKKSFFLQKNVVDYIRIRGNLADTYSDDEIHRAIGILRWILRLKKVKINMKNKKDTMW